jgi:hypothetical protein
MAEPASHSTSEPQPHATSASRTLRARGGCLPRLGLLFLPLLILAACAVQIRYWQRIDAEGQIVRCTVDRKDEQIRRPPRSDNWHPVFRVELDCPWRGDPGAPLIAAFETDEQEFDRIHRGTPFDLRYVSEPSLLRVVFSTWHLARESTDSLVRKALARWQPGFVIAGYLACLGLLGFIVSKRLLPRAGWALLIVVLIGILYLLMPTWPVVVTGRLQQTTATVKELHTFTRLLNSSRSDGIQASTPYELVVLQFVPAGRSEPVLAADTIDVSSRKDLAVDQQVPIDYEVDHPRRANIQHATRRYAVANVEGAFVYGVLTMGFLVGGAFLLKIGRERAKKALIDARERARDRAL